MFIEYHDELIYFFKKFMDIKRKIYWSYVFLQQIVPTKKIFTAISSELMNILS